MYHQILGQLTAHHNKNTILKQLDQLLNSQGIPPDVELIFVEPYTTWNVLWSGLGLSRNPYGHVALRYRSPSTFNEHKILNIRGVSSGTIAHFIQPEEYFFGTNNFDSGAEQGGVYNRQMFSVRLEKVQDWQLEELDHYAKKLVRRSSMKDAKYSLLFAPLYNILSAVSPLRMAERGNCARWTSNALVEAELLRSPTLWPKNIFIDLFETHGRRDPENIHVVRYDLVTHAQHAYGNAKVRSFFSGVAPLHPLRTLQYLRLENFAHAAVYVPEGSMEAFAERRKPSKGPSFLRHHLFSICMTPLIVTGTLLRTNHFTRMMARNLFNQSRDRILNATRSARQNSSRYRS
eukprot:gb/GECH01008824.1/.p1 GENE.gb/GECH01008824.1/~~gb/GECH01008824.1/.p1  ORF type:complete len:347 (+),score=51.06 gb/GECH01008824.1/:1-1041(+)